MSLTGNQFQKIEDALLDAFNHDSLSRMVRLELGVRLEDVAQGQNVSVIVHRLVEWADREGRVPDLIDSALGQNPGNPNLQSLANDVKTWHLEPPEEGEEPYQGLNFFDVDDADRFFGREALTVELVDYLRDHRLLAVIGASGSGKSSVVRAGVVVALKDGTLPGSDGWPTHIITPTAHPLKALAATLTKDSESVTAQSTLMDDMAQDARSLDLYTSRLVADRSGQQRRLLLVVDQFEELFTLCRDQEEQRAFVDNLLTAAVPDGVTTVILTLRADFYAHCADFANLRTAMENDQRYIGAMSEEELRAAIVKPAQQGGWDLEPGLPDLMLNDVADEPGALPLLSHALLETWKRRSRRMMLTFAGYYAAGGVQGAIAHTADAVYGQFDGDEQAIARSIFLRLTELGEGVQDTRRRVPLQELVPRTGVASTVENVLQKLQDQRLVTTVREEQERAGQETDGTEPVVYVDVTHEALIREWPALKDWLAEDRDGLRTHRKLTETAQEWERLNHDPGVLYRGLPLDQTAAWAAEHADDLNEAERMFLAESQAQVEAAKREQEQIEREREEARQRELEQAQALAAEEIRARNRMRWLLMVVGLALVVALSATWYIFSQNEQLGSRNEELATERQNARIAEETAVAGAAIAEDARATAEANVELAQQQLQEVEGLTLLEQARDARDARDVEAAVEKFEAAAAVDPTLGIDVAQEISETLRYAAIQLVYEGEELAAQGDHEGAAGTFEAALDLEPPSDTPVYVLIPEGEFVMGSGDGDFWATDDDKPRHMVFLDSYWILRTEVTNEQYRRCVEANECGPPENERWHSEEYGREPVTDVSWHQASNYAAFVGGRLPTEAEWERACRGVEGTIYPWGDDPPDPTRLNYSESGLKGVVSVGSYPAGANGLYDMAGNVREWTSSLFQYYPYDADDVREDPKADGDRTVRGGSWGNYDGYVRCANRDNNDPYYGYFVPNGFRVVSPGF